MVRVLPYHMGYDCTFYHQYNNTHTVCTVVLALLLDILYSECMLISYRTVVRYDTVLRTVQLDQAVSSLSLKTTYSSIAALSLHPGTF